MKLRLKISPCPNDTFAFYALLHSLIDNEGVDFDVDFEDIETLNCAILSSNGDVIKASIAVAPRVKTDYQLLSSGAALGCGNGPIVVRKEHTSATVAGIKTVALPGENTTAALLFNRYFKDYTPRYEVFNQIAKMVKNEKVELGVLIHEGRFTFESLGLEQVADLGEMWELESSMPLPLGGIFANRNIDYKQVERIIRRSVEWALNNPKVPLDFVRRHASELSEEVMQSHIDYFVNSYTVNLGLEGQQVIENLCNCTLF